MVMDGQYAGNAGAFFGPARNCAPIQCAKLAFGS
jgi:hypothetical protein